jgi:tungstate transport system ATP-binding protein
MLYKADILTKVFKGRKVLNLEHLAIERHKIYALIGANGAGKTTLLNLLAFLVRPTSGHLQFCGQDVSFGRQHLLDLRRRVVLVDQYPILFTGPVWKNVEFGLTVRGISKKLRERRVAEVLELVGMREFRLADAHKLSGGESKRVALARALAIDPEVLLCDEPTANVDEENQEIILGILERINREKQTSILMATHYLSQSRRLAHHTLMLEHGMLSDKGNENIYRCRVTRENNGFFLCTVNDQVSLRLGCQQFPDLPEYCRVFINPKKVQWVSHPDTHSGNRMTGHVIRIEQDKGLVRLTMDCGIRLNVVLAMREYLLRKPTIGEEITVSLPDKSILFSTLEPSGIAQK